MGASSNATGTLLMVMGQIMLELWTFHGWLDTALAERQHLRMTPEASMTPETSAYFRPATVEFSLYNIDVL